MVAVFCFSDSHEIPDDGVYMFASSEAAEEWQFGVMVNAGVACVRTESGEGEFYGLKDDDGWTWYATKEEAIEAWQSTFELLEFFHAYSVTDFRKGGA